MIDDCTADPCRFLPSTCPSPMPPNTTCHVNYCAHAVSTRSGREVAICGAVWVDVAGDREVCGTFRDEPYTLIGYEHDTLYEGYKEGHAENLIISDNEYADNCKIYFDRPAGGKTVGLRRSVWLWAGAAGGLVLVVVMGLALVYLRDGVGTGVLCSAGIKPLLAGRMHVTPLR